MTQLGTGELSDLRVRPYGRADRDRLIGMSAQLSPQSLYTRFFSGTPGIPEMYVRALHGIDHWDHDAVIAMIDGTIVGIAEYVRDREDPSGAEIAVLIADRWQRQGVARRLVDCLAELATRRGISHFDAEVLLGNAAALQGIGSRWPAAPPHREAGTARFRLGLPRRHGRPAANHCMITPGEAGTAGHQAPGHHAAGHAAGHGVAGRRTAGHQAAGQRTTGDQAAGHQAAGHRVAGHPSAWGRPGAQM